MNPKARVPRTVARNHEPEERGSALAWTKPEEIMRPEALARYEEVAAWVRDSLIQLNTNNHLMRVLSDRPKFVSGPTQELFGYLGQNVFQYNVVVAHRVWSDGGRDTLTLRTLRKVVMEGAREEWLPAIRDALRDRPGKEAEEILARVARARNARVAHLLDPASFDPERPGVPVNLSDLEKAGAALGEFYKALHFGSSYILLYGNFWDGGSIPYIRALLAANSNASAFYDKHEDYWWRKIRPSLSAEDIEELNRARKTAGKPPIPFERPETG